MTFTADHMRKYVEENGDLVSVRIPPEHHELRILKYKNKVFYKSLWTPEMCELRGTVVDENFNIVMRPPTKVFNYHERKGAHIDDGEIVKYSTKINGFMAQATVYQGKLLVATTGTMHSEYATLARKYIEALTEQIRGFGDRYTWVFEVVDPSDPHIIDEKPGLYLLAARRNTWDSQQTVIPLSQLESIARAWGIFSPEYGTALMGELLAWSKHITHEGYVVYGQDITLKLKSRYYLVTKFLGRLKDMRLEAMLSKQARTRREVDEEYYPLIDYLIENKEVFLTFDSQGRIKFIRDFLTKN